MAEAIFSGLAWIMTLNNRQILSGLFVSKTSPTKVLVVKVEACCARLFSMEGVLLVTVKPLMLACY